MDGNNFSLSLDKEIKEEVYPIGGIGVVSRAATVPSHSSSQPPMCPHNPNPKSVVPRYQEFNCLGALS